VPRLELLRAEGLGGYRDVLLLAARVGKPEVDELDLLLLDHLQYIVRGHAHGFSWFRGASKYG
jgi:hypothetical protein